MSLGFNSIAFGDVEERNKYPTKGSGVLEPLYNSILSQQIQWGFPNPILIPFIIFSFSYFVHKYAHFYLSSIYMYIILYVILFTYSIPCFSILCLHFSSHIFFHNFLSNFPVLDISIFFYNWYYRLYCKQFNYSYRLSSKV